MSVLGKIVYKIVCETGVNVEGLSKQDTQALETYRKQRPTMNFINSIKLINSPGERKVIWITGTQENENKRWFQGYSEGFYGFARVIRLDLRIKHASTCNVLKK